MFPPEPVRPARRPGSVARSPPASVGCVLARTAPPGPKATGLRLPLPGAGAPRRPGQALPSVGVGCDDRRATFPPEPGRPARRPGSVARSPPASVGCVLARTAPGTQSDRAAPAPPGGWRFAPAGAGTALWRCVLSRSRGDVPTRPGPLFHRKIGFSAQPGIRPKARALSRQGPVTLPLRADPARTARSPKATGQRLPLRGAGAIAPSGAGAALC